MENTPEFTPDFKELLRLFHSTGVEYLVVGAFALAVHGAPRYTGDLDLWVSTSSENAQRVYEALVEFGFGETGISPALLQTPDRVFRTGKAPSAVDMLTTISGVSWDDAWPTRMEVEYRGTKFWVRSAEVIIKNKLASGRWKDAGDAARLQAGRKS